MEWKTLSSEYISRHKYFTLRKDRCLTPSGKEIPDYYVVELDMSVCALAITEDNQVLLVKQYRHPIRKTILELPGGFIDKKEDPAKAVAREILEETGYEFKDVEFVGTIAANPAVLDNYTNLYVAKGGKKVGKQNLDPTEEIEIVLMPLQDLIDMVMENKMDQALHLACVFYALQKLGKLKISL
jgi:ADP-ribose pyrophosphatase